MGASVTLTKPDPSTGIDKVVDSLLSASDSAALAAANANYTTATAAYVPGTAKTPGRGFLASVTTAGTVTLTFGGIDIPFTLAVGPTILPLAISKVTAGTAVGTYYPIS